MLTLCDTSTLLTGRQAGHLAW